MRSIAYSLPPLPWLPLPQPSAPWPVWRDSTVSPVRYQPLSKRAASRLYYDAQRFERQTRRPGRQDGALGRNGLAILRALLFDIIRHATGRLDPSYATIARHAIISIRSVARGLVRLKAAGVLNWLRRCREDRDEDGQFRLRQETNAYAVLPTSQWRGFIDSPPVPVEPWQLGLVPPLPAALDEAATAVAAGVALDAVIARLRADPRDKLAAALAGLGSAILDKP